jgi:hypothetical protein
VEDTRTNREHYLTIVNSHGRVLWQYQTSIKIFCPIDIKNFPFDTQVCYLKIRSSARDISQIKIIKRNDRVKTFQQIITEWFLIYSDVTETTEFLYNTNETSIEFSVLKFTLKLRRKVVYYFMKIIFPFTAITSITLFTFWYSFYFCRSFLMIFYAFLLSLSCCD